MNSELIEKVLNLPRGFHRGSTLFVGIPSDDEDLFDPPISTNDLISLARQAQAGAKLAKAAKRYLHLEGVDVFSSECNDAEAELRAALAECDKIMGGGK